MRVSYNYVNGCINCMVARTSVSMAVVHTGLHAVDDNYYFYCRNLNLGGLLFRKLLLSQMTKKNSTSMCSLPT